MGDEEASSDDEQVDARLLYPRRDAEEISEEEGDEEVEGKFEEAVVKSIVIMEASCFGQMEDEEWEDGKDKRLNCEKCNRQFSSRKWLARHLYAHTFVVKESGKERVICSSCGKEFSTRPKWLQHAERRNCPGSPKTIFPCNLCGKIFTRKDNLREHLKAHAGSRTRRRPLHSCNECGKKFGSG